MSKKEPWWKTAKEWVCSECGTVNPMGQDYCSGCDCSLERFEEDFPTEEEIIECAQSYQETEKK